jgi:outer membrane protein assembly factor BamB
MNKSCLLPALISAGLTLNVASATDAPPAERNWPAWRGPLANGVAPRATPPVSWSETSNVKWKVKTPGRGMSTPIIWENQIFLQSAIATGNKPEASAPKTEARSNVPQVAGQTQTPPEGSPDGQRRRRGGPGGGRGEKPAETHQFALVCLDRATGRTLWQKTAREEVPHEGHHRDHGFASHSPITDGEHVYAWFGSRGLHAFDLKGNVKWSKDFGRMRTRNAFGEGSSPALSGNTLVVVWDHEDEDFIAAVDKRTGKELWRQPRDEATTWTTPLIVPHAGKPQVVVSASTRIRSYDLATGKELWQCGGMTGNVIPAPVTDFGLVYAISGFRGSALLAIKLGRSGDLTDTDAIAWRHGKSTPYVPSPLLYGDKLYFFGGNNGLLSCFEAKAGKPLMDGERIEALPGVYASPVGAAGRVYLAGRNGAVVVIKHGEKLEVLATNRLDEKFDASPAAVGNELFLRGHEHLYCLAEK